VSSGRAKMIANAIMFSNPTLKAYNKLPPSREELDEVLAFIFTGIAQPTEDDFKRTSLLVHRNKVALALEWLKLNHINYTDLEISEENLQSYSLEGVPVVVDYKKISSDSNRIATSMSMHDNEDEESTTDGSCPFIVHGLTGAEYEILTMQAIKTKALQHLDSRGKYWL
jgi:arsenate reductase-like glutaredoxin family protein